MKQVKIPKPSRKSLVKVNLGCGGNIVKGFINIDDYYLPEHPDFVRGNAKAIPLEANSVDYLLCDQMMEHLPMHDVIPVLYEIRRVLKTGGKAVIIVPDFKDVAEEWLKYNHNENFNPMTYQFLSEPIYGNQHHAGEFHQTPMSAGLLHYSLMSAGMPNHTIAFWPRNGTIPSFEGMTPYLKNSILRNAQLVVEVTK